MVAGLPPIRTTKARYFDDRRFVERILPPPHELIYADADSTDDWSRLPSHYADLRPKTSMIDTDNEGETTTAVGRALMGDSSTNSSLHRVPDLDQHQDTRLESTKLPRNEFELEQSDDPAAESRVLARTMRGVARQVTLDPEDGMEL